MKKYYHPFSLFLVFIPFFVLFACGQSHQVSTVGAISSTSIQNAPDYPAPLSPSVIPPPRASETPITQSSAPSLLNASPEEVGRVALQVTESRFPSLSGQSQLALAAPVTPDDLLAYGLPSEDANQRTPPASQTDLEAPHKQQSTRHDWDRLRTLSNQDFGIANRRQCWIMLIGNDSFLRPTV